MSWGISTKKDQNNTGDIEENNRFKSLIPRQRGILFLMVAVVLAAAVFLAGGYAMAKKTVTLEVDGRVAELNVVSRTVDGVLKKQNVVLYEKDEVIPSPDTQLTDGMIITVKRAVDVCIAVDGREISARTVNDSVEEVLDEYEIALGPEDEVSPAKDAAIEPEMKIEVARIIISEEIKEEVINYQTTRKNTTNLAQGETRITQAGRNGTERQTWQVKMRDGVEVSRQLLSREVIAPAVTQVVMVGSPMLVTRGGEDIRYSNAREMVATAYTYTGRNTASGVPPRVGGIAVDTSQIPFGTRMYVEGYGYATALDRGSAIKGNRIDVFFETRQEALRWGVRRVKVYFLD